MPRIKTRRSREQSGKGYYHKPLSLDEKKRGVVVIKYVPFNRMQDQLTPTPVCKILVGM